MAKHKDFVLLTGVETAIVANKDSGGKIEHANLVLICSHMTPDEYLLKVALGIKPEVIQTRLVFSDLDAVKELINLLKEGMIRVSSTMEHGQFPHGLGTENINPNNEKEK